MCYLSFQLAVVLLAIKLFAAPPSPDAAHHSTARAGQGLVKPSDVQKLTMLLHRLNSTSAAGRLVGSAFNEAFGAMVVALGKKDAASRKVCLLAVPQMSSFVQKAAEAGLGGCGNLSNLHKTPRAVRVERTPVTSWKSVRQALNHVQAETLDRGMQGPPPQGGEGLVTEGGDAGGPDVHTFVGGSGEGGTVQKGLEGEVHEGPGMSNGLQHHGKLAGETRE
uniref:Uncharacterized protein n=1 Tax=Chromera velia CCMP2878 TaxID=1169474 RepID=A0A0G4IAQ7_9ALVE|eukprot:Cvel_12521.t1-p1 / transcript=Cvel_12521.t1 / gene=Cvel_12521 / organism=Chromera_velia_CCMP2878 / gene_product=hypothetical protein / transcript_product=hypothetical protein / location=Cvel_scaffold822:11063-12113(-) / protein_length=220 / sequence_SO=supercontig / SO=protein_coding / is_pseudo=false